MLVVRDAVRPAWGRHGAMGGVAAPAAGGAGGSALAAGLLELRLRCDAAGAGPRSLVKRVPGAPRPPAPAGLGCGARLAC